MTNFEKYKDEILDIIKNGWIKVTKDGKMTVCSSKCEDCAFYYNNVGGCRNAFIKWLYAETKPTLTAKERAFCEIIQGGYITREKDGKLFYWYGISICIEIESFNFPFITWEDEKPWSIEELLKLEVEK